MSKFKTGDRVVFTGNGDTKYVSADRGTVVEKCTDRGDENRWWVDWDDGSRLNCGESDMEFEPMPRKILTVGEMKDLLNKMDDSIKLSFDNLQIHFG